MPCAPVSIDIPSGPSGSSIPGVGVPFSLKLPGVPSLDGFPENLLDLLNKLQMLIPPGILKPQLSPNFGKDIFDSILKLMDQFLPFLMLYKFFLPILKLILCIIEVLCALKHPFKVIKAMKKLFRNCLPDFLNLFPIFALIMMIISLLLLLLALIEYIIQQIIKFIKLILRNIIALQKAIADANDNSILAIAKKIGSLLCIFQNLFVLLELFSIIIQVFRDILSMVFAIPPCDDTDSIDINDPDYVSKSLVLESYCCTTDVCPNIIKSNYIRKTGKLQYFNQVSFVTTTPFPGDPSGTGFLSAIMRNEVWQLYDEYQEETQQFRNIFDSYDVTVKPKPVFFPTDSVYNAATPPKQAAYTLDLRLFYYPSNWNRIGQPRWIIFKDCIMINVPNTNLINFDKSNSLINNGVVVLAGGLGYEDDGTTILNGFDVDGIIQINNQATLENFIHKKITQSTILSNDGVLFDNIEYTFKPNQITLFSKDLVVTACSPDFTVEKAYVANVLVGSANVALAELSDLLKPENGFPDPSKTQEELSVAVSGLLNNLTIDGINQFETTAMASLGKLKDNTNTALGNLIGLGYDPCRSYFIVNPAVQFTSRPISISVYLNERNGTSLTTGLSQQVAENIATRIKSHLDFGTITNFVYDGYQAFTAYLTSDSAVKGHLTISFDSQIFCNNIMPSDINIPSTHTLQDVYFQFAYTPTAGISKGVGVGIGSGVGEGAGIGEVTKAVPIGPTGPAGPFGPIGPLGPVGYTGPGTISIGPGATGATGIGAGVITYLPESGEGDTTTQPRRVDNDLSNK